MAVYRFGKLIPQTLERYQKIKNSPLNTEDIKKIYKLVDVNATDERGQSALHFFAINGKTENMKMILQDPRLPANAINEKDNAGESPLHIAASNRNTEILKMILQDPRLSANAINVLGVFGTSLHIAAYKGNTEIVKIILLDPKLSIDTINSLNYEGHTVLDLAKKINSAEIIALLKAHGAKE